MILRQRRPYIHPWTFTSGLQRKKNWSKSGYFWPKQKFGDKSPAGSLCSLLPPHLSWSLILEPDDPWRASVYLSVPSLQVQFLGCYHRVPTFLSRTSSWSTSSVSLFFYSFSLVLERSSLRSGWCFCRCCSHLNGTVERSGAQFNTL